MKVHVKEYLSFSSFRPFRLCRAVPRGGSNPSMLEIPQPQSHILVSKQLKTKVYANKTLPLLQSPEVRVAAL
jgi:hypothetical protein